MGEVKRDKILSDVEVAKRLGVGVCAVQNALRKGIIKGTYFHRKWHIRESAYEDYLLNKKDPFEHKTELTISEAARELGVSDLIIKRAVELGRIEIIDKSKGEKLSVRSFRLWEKGFQKTYLYA